MIIPLSCMTGYYQKAIVKDFNVVFVCDAPDVNKKVSSKKRKQSMEKV